jgi:DNA-binding MarR family transcriptional regulator
LPLIIACLIIGGMTGSARHQFFVDDGGRLHESSVHDTLERLLILFPDIEPSSLEAEIAIERCHRLLALERDAGWAPLGLTGSRFVLLRNLYSSPDKRLSMGQIAARMNLEANNVTQLIAALVSQGWVTKENDRADKRVIYACITPDGEELFVRAMEDNAERIEHAFSVLSSRERLNLSHLLSKVRMHLLANASRLDGDHPMDRNRAAGKGRVGTMKQ